MKENEFESRERYSESVCYNLYQKLRRLYHWAPIVALFIIFYIAAVSILCILYIYPPLSSIYCFLHFVVYIYQFYLVMNNYLTSSFIGPGFVPLGWMPIKEEDKKYLQYCDLCEGFKPPRSHHCRKCDRCILKMDHHCPWINTCVGHFNHGYFVYFLLFAPIGCVHSTYLLTKTLYYAVFLDYFLTVDYGSIVFLGLWEFLAIFFGIGLALGVVLAVGSLWVFQMKSIIQNETGIETWIKSKSKLRERKIGEPPFIYPYDLGRYRNMRQVLTWKGNTLGNGVVWPVREGCGQYDLTIEQKKQKQDKDAHSELFEIKHDFNGALLPFFTLSCREVCGSPCTDENRMPLTKGQIVKVTRWRKYWLYGQLISGSKLNTSSFPGGNDVSYIKIKPRGWFPLSCARKWRGELSGAGDSALFTGTEIQYQINGNSGSSSYGNSNNNVRVIVGGAASNSHATNSRMKKD